jgi:hypothetical protein
LLENLTVERKLYNGVGKIRPPELGNSTPPLTVYPKFGGYLRSEMVSCSFQPTK